MRTRTPVKWRKDIDQFGGYLGGVDCGELGYLEGVNEELADRIIADHEQRDRLREALEDCLDELGPCDESERARGFCGHAGSFIRVGDQCHIAQARAALDALKKE